MDFGQTVLSNTRSSNRSNIFWIKLKEFVFELKQDSKEMITKGNIIFN